MKKAKKLIKVCKSKNLNCSITYQRINDCSVEIYTGYGENYKGLFYTDGHSKPKEAIKEALLFLTNDQ